MIVVDILIWILIAILWVLLAVLLILLIAICLKITLFVNYNEKLKLTAKILFFKFDILKIIEKSKEKPEKTKKQKKSKKETIEVKDENLEDKILEIEKKSTENKEREKVNESDDNDEKNEEKSSFKFDLSKKDDYLKSIELGIDALSEFTNSITFDKIDVKARLGTDDTAKTGQLLGVFWVFYGFMTAFLISNFKIKDYKVDVLPNWEAKTMEIDEIDAEIIVHTRILRIIRHIKYKNIIEIRKRVL